MRSAIQPQHVVPRYRAGTHQPPAGNHYSNQATVTERFAALGPNHIRYEATLEDPQTFTRPWTIEMPLYRLIDPQAQLFEHKCVPFADTLLYQDLLLPDTRKEQE